MTNLLAPGSSCLVVVADDEPAWRLLVRLLLEPQGYQLVEACDGVDALHAVETFHPRILLLDLMMPRMDGLEVCRRLLSGHIDPLPAIIVMTAADDAAALPCAAAIGADRVLAKPFDPAKLLGAIKSLAAGLPTASG